MAACTSERTTTTTATPTTSSKNVWAWASGERIIAINYRAHRNVWRRVIVRGDGCGTPKCSGSGNPNVGFTVYDSHDVSVQNMLIVDRILAPTDSPYSDFAVAQHTADPRYYFGRNEWLGTLSLNSPDIGYSRWSPTPGRRWTRRSRSRTPWPGTRRMAALTSRATRPTTCSRTCWRTAAAAMRIRVPPELASLGGALREHDLRLQGAGTLRDRSPLSSHRM